MAVPGECSLSAHTTCAMWQKHCHQLKFSGTKHCSAGRCSLASFLQRDGGHGVLPPHAHPCMSRCSLGSATLGPGSNAKQSIPMPALLARACAHTHTPAHVCCLTRVGACFALGSVSLQSPQRHSTMVGASQMKGKHCFAFGTSSGAGLAWQETLRVAALQQSQQGVSRKVPTAMLRRS